MAAPGEAGELRIGLTISGAVSLGSFEGGALAALITAAQAVNATDPDALRIDAIAGASAGSMTAVLAARTLLAGLDPIATMYEAWVTTPDIKLLRDGLRAPLTVDGAQVVARRLLTASGDRPRQIAPVRLNMALGSLRRLDYEIGRIGGPPVRASTYLDWQKLTFDRDSPDEDYVGPDRALDVALASGAHAGAFRARGLDRSADRPGYERNHIDDPPRFVWYTDGGTLDNQPLGRALDLTFAIDNAPESRRGRAGRLHLLISSDPATEQHHDDEWTDRAHQPRWLISGQRVIPLLLAQHLYDDMRRLEKTNSRISWTRELADTLSRLLAGRAGETEVLDELKRVTGRIAAQQDALLSDADHRFDRRPRGDDTAGAIADAVHAALQRATGFGEKDYVDLAVVSPLHWPRLGDAPPSSALAGGFLGHFGGFLRHDLRENDFACGYDCMVSWMAGRHGLAARGLSYDRAQRAIAAAHEARAAHDWETELGGMTLRRVGWRSQRALRRVARRTLVIAANDWWHRRRGAH